MTGKSINRLDGLFNLDPAFRTLPINPGLSIGSNPAARAQTDIPSALSALVSHTLADWMHPNVPCLARPAFLVTTLTN